MQVVAYRHHERHEAHITVVVLDYHLQVAVYAIQGHGVQRRQGTGHHGLAVGVAETVTIEYVGILLVVLLGRYRQHPRIGYHQCPVVVTLQYVARLESLP